MNTLIHIPTTFAKTLRLIVISRQERSRLAELIATMALAGPFSIVAGSERLPSYKVARLLHDRTKAIKQIFNEAHIVRAPTCFQLIDLLENTRPIPEPLLVLDFLHTFYDQDIPMQVRMRILSRCIAQLERLALSRMVTVLTEYMEGDDYVRFYPLLEHFADKAIQIEREKENDSQPSLF